MKQHKLGNTKTDGQKPSPLGELLISHNMRQYKFADAMGLHRSTVNEYIWVGMRGASGDTLSKIADFFGVTTDYLLERET